MDSKETRERLTRIEAKLDAALEKVATHAAYIRIGAAITLLMATELVRMIWK